MKISGRSAWKPNEGPDLSLNQAHRAGEISMFSVWTNVIVSNADHARTGTAGSVQRVNAVTHPDSVVVQFDTDGKDANGVNLPGSSESMLIADLSAL